MVTAQQSLHLIRDGAWRVASTREIHCVHVTPESSTAVGYPTVDMLYDSGRASHSLHAARRTYVPSASLALTATTLITHCSHRSYTKVLSPFLGH